MTFEYADSRINYNIPDLIIPVSEILKAKDHDKDEMAYQECSSFKRCINIYTSYCGGTMRISSQEFDKLIKQIGRSGNLIISCLEEGDEPDLLFRLISNNKERELKIELIPSAQGRIRM